MELFSPKRLNTLNKTPLGWTGCLSNLYYLLAFQASNFFNSPPQRLCDLWDAMPRHWPSSAFHTTFA